MTNLGKVILIGAGPGDEGLLTRRAERVLANAEIVLVDRLVGPGIRALINPDAQVVDVGKACGNHPVPQREINRLLLRYARDGKLVVRLKGGDPYLFGRGAEELEAVIRESVPFEVVPGISASIAVPAWAGIPVTHRDHSSSVHILTGHRRQGGGPAFDYVSLAKLGGTLVFMMGFSAMEDILKGLMQAGLGADTPAALIQNGTLPGQRKLVATAETLYDRAREAGIKAPAVLVVGAVCALHEALDWASRRPLSGRTILVTRPVSSGGELREKLAQLGADAIAYPCIHLRPRAEIHLPQDFSAYGWVVFTSAFGVKVFFDLLLVAGRDIRSLTGVRIAAIGSRTRGELESRGILADFVPEVYDACHLGEGLADLMETGKKALLFRASLGTRELTAALDRHGASWEEIAAYDTLYQSPVTPQVQSLLRQGTVNYVTFTSASTVEGFVRAVGLEPATSSAYKAVCIGQSTARAAEQYGLDVLCSRQATLDSMVEAILDNEKGESGDGLD